MARVIPYACLYRASTKHSIWPWGQPTTRPPKLYHISVTPDRRKQHHARAPYDFPPTRRHGGKQHSPLPLQLVIFQCHTYMYVLYDYIKNDGGWTAWEQAYSSGGHHWWQKTNLRSSSMIRRASLESSYKIQTIVKNVEGSLYERWRTDQRAPGSCFLRSMEQIYGGRQNLLDFFTRWWEQVSTASAHGAGSW